MTKTNDSKPQDAKASQQVELDQRLLELLVCPLTKKPLVYNKETNELVSNSAKLAYPIRDGIPIMLPDEARDLS